MAGTPLSVDVATNVGPSKTTNEVTSGARSGVTFGDRRPPEEGATVPWWLVAVIVAALAWAWSKRNK